MDVEKNDYFFEQSIRKVNNFGIDQTKSCY